MNKWNNKFRCQVASCWLFVLSYTTMHGSMNIKNKMCFFIFSTILSETFLILRINERVMIKIYRSLHVKYRCYSCPLLMKNFIFSTDFRIFEYKISWKFVQLELSCSIRTDRETQTERQTYMTKLIVSFRNFTSTPKNFRFVYKFGKKMKHMTNV